jgi:hypothetical protein
MDADELRRLSESSGLTSAEMGTFGLAERSLLEKPEIDKLLKELDSNDTKDFQRFYTTMLSPLQRTTNPTEMLLPCALLQKEFAPWLSWVDRHLRDSSGSAATAEVREACAAPQDDAKKAQESLQRFLLVAGRLWRDSARASAAFEPINEWLLEQLQHFQASLTLVVDVGRPNGAPILIGERGYVRAPEGLAPFESVTRVCNNDLSACRITFVGGYGDTETARTSHKTMACGQGDILDAEFLIDGDVTRVRFPKRYMKLGCEATSVRLPEVVVRGEAAPASAPPTPLPLTGGAAK